jgi:glycosyltransferase involved in cell wall biosynthesis
VGTGHAQPTPLPRLEGLIDSVYFLMANDLHEELESNRWHYARRWARHLPVTLLQPSADLLRSPAVKAVRKIPNCEILSIAHPNPEGSYPLGGLVQAGQVMQHMRERGYAKPLLWSYNPRLSGLCAAVPAVGRVYHATENYFDFENLSDFFYRELEASLRISDVVISVSSGVAAGIRSRVPSAHVVLATNGCDTTQYQPGGPLSGLIASARDEFARVAAFAGNINGRLDFELIEEAAAANERTLLVFVGPASALAGEELDRWRRIVRLENVLHLGSMGPDELAALYRSSDLGFIPYRFEQLLMRNGFPLKTLEMAATGLPVVATMMEPITGLASAIDVAESREQFLMSFSSVSRSTLTEEERLELLEVAAANDYDRKFEQVVAGVVGSVRFGGEVHTQLDDLLLALGYEPWRTSCGRILDRFTAPPLLLAFASVYARFAAILPTWIRRLVPGSLKDQVRGHRVE